MTRINVIPPSELTDSHLGAEYMELPRIFQLAYKSMIRGEDVDDKRNPREYTLGEGHVRFFYPRLKFLANRFDQIVSECERRGRNCSYKEVPNFYNMVPEIWKKDYEPTEEAMALNRARIQLRLSGSKE
jgi:hypothetical protein